MSEETTNAQHLVASINNFAVSMYRRTAEEMLDKNILSSPISVFTALAITYLGAKNNTAKQLADIVGFGGVPHFHETLQEFLERLTSLSSEGVTVQLSNYILQRKGLQTRKEFEEGCKKHYETDIHVSNFSEPMEVCSLVNDRVLKDTNGRIKELLQKKHIEPSTAMLLINAIYFKSTWFTKFNQEASNVMPFRVNPQTTMDAEMMNLKEMFNFGVCRSMRCQALELPYQNKNLSMIILLPLEDDGISGLEKSLTKEALDNIFQNMMLMKINVTIPRGHMGCMLQLKPVLQQLGVLDLFDEHKGDLSGIESTRSLFVSDVIQKSFIEVTEEGTEAAAATAVVMKKKTMSRVERFNADHPFIFLIKENITNGILLIGRYMAPE